MVPHSTTRLLIALAVMLLSPATTAAERKLLILESVPPGAELHVLDVAGIQLAQNVAPSTTWKIKPGDGLTAPARPPDRLIELYTGTLQAPALLARLLLRYYRSSSGWTAHFRLDEEPLVAKVHGRWQPFELIRGTGGALVRHGHALPNAEGFFPTIEFGLSAGLLPIVAWQVVH